MYRRRHPCQTAAFVFLIHCISFIAGCGFTANNVNNAYGQFENHMMKTGTASVGFENGYGSDVSPASFPELPVRCTTDIPNFMACAGSKNFPIDTASKADNFFDLPFALGDWKIRSAWGTVNMAIAGKHVDFRAAIQGNAGLMFTVKIQGDEHQCRIRIDSPHGHHGRWMKSPGCTISIPQIFFQNDLPAPPIKIVYEKTEGAVGSTFSLNLTVEYEEPPPEAMADPDTAPNEDGIQTPDAEHFSDTWGTCDSSMKPDDNGYTAAFKIAIYAAQTPSNPKCFSRFPHEVLIESISGESGYRGGGDGRASINYWLYADQHAGLARCCDGPILMGEKVALPYGAAQCVIPDPENGSCIIPLEGVHAPPITFFRPIPARKITVYFNSDLATAHPPCKNDPTKTCPDVIVIKVHFRTSR